MNLSISNINFSSKPTDKDMGSIVNSLHSTNCFLDHLANIIENGQTICPAIFKRGTEKRTCENFEMAQIFVIDIDNNIPSLDEIGKYIKYSLAYKSFSGKGLHLVISLNGGVGTCEDFRNSVDALIYQLEKNGIQGIDHSCNQPQRIYFGTNDKCEFGNGHYTMAELQQIRDEYNASKTLNNDEQVNVSSELNDGPLTQVNTVNEANNDTNNINEDEVQENNTIIDNTNTNSEVQVNENEEVLSTDDSILNEIDNANTTNELQEKLNFENNNNTNNEVIKKQYSTASQLLYDTKFMKAEDIWYKYNGIFEFITKTTTDKMAERKKYYTLDKFRRWNKNTKSFRMFKIGSNRRNRLYLMMSIVKNIKPNITFEELLFNAILERKQLFVNTDNKLSDRYLWSMCKAVINNNNFVMETTTRIVTNKVKCAEAGISYQKAAAMVRRQEKMTAIMSVYNKEFSKRKNCDMLNELGIKISYPTLCKYLKDENPNVVKMSKKDMIVKYYDPSITMRENLKILNANNHNISEPHLIKILREITGQRKWKYYINEVLNNIRKNNDNMAA